MSDSDVTAKEVGAVEKARTLLAEREDALAKLDAEKARVEADLTLLEGLSDLELDETQMFALFKARRALRRIETERPTAAAAMEAARTALAQAEHARDLAILASIRAEVATLRPPLDALLERIAASEDMEEAVWNLQAEDPMLVKLCAQVADLDACARRARDLNLTPDERSIDAAPWSWLPTHAGHRLFAALVARAKDMKAQREEEEQAEEQARIRAEEIAYEQSLKPRVLHCGEIEAAGARAYKPGSSVAYVFTKEQAAALPRSPALASAVHDPHRAIAVFTEEALALAAAQDEHAAQALRSAAGQNAHGVHFRAGAPPAREAALADDDSAGTYAVEYDNE